MPIYEYQCGKCENVTEVFQSHMDDPPPSKCPNCGAKKKMRRLMSETAFQLKGGGWYKDLYSSKRPSSDGATSEAKSDKGEKGEKKSEPAEKKSETKEKKESKPKAKPASKD
jgi:putative FmdB family regulatory protein